MIIAIIFFWSFVPFTVLSQTATVTPADFSTLPTIEWQFKTSKSIYASPLVSEGVVYAGGLDSILHAIDVRTGKELWDFRTNGEIRSAVCINASNLYLNGGDGMLYALNKSTGKELWKFTTKGESKYDFADYFHSSPVLSNGVIYFGSGDGNFYAINASSGSLLWQFRTGGIIHTTAAIDNGMVFFGSFDGYVYALSIRDGALIWRFKTVGHRYFPKGEVQGSPAVYKGLVFIGARDYNIYAIDQNRGFCHWNKAFTRGWGLCTTVYDSLLYIGSSDERVLMAVEPESGTELWKKNMEFLIFGNTAYSKTMMYVGTTIGKLHGIDMATGEKKWSFETESYLKNRAKYFKPDDSYRDDIYSIITSNEHFLDVECELGGIFSTPCISGDNIIFTSTNGSIYCLKR
jgi:outer membrane protein assembly factor BamB